MLVNLAVADAGKSPSALQSGTEPADASKHVEEPDILCPHDHPSFLKVVIKMFKYLLVIVTWQHFYVFKACLAQHFPVAPIQDEMFQLIAGNYGKKFCLLVKSLF